MSADAWPFESYPKIAEDLSRYRLDEAAARALSRVEWIATEKIHGANTCFATDGQSVRCAKRKAWLEPGERFFDHHRVEVHIEPAVRDILAALQRDDPTIANAYVFGELFGGAYPHPEVEAVSGLQPVQTGVYYHPDIRFAAFDLAVTRQDGSWAFLAFDEALKRFQDAGLFAVEPLFRGRLEATQGLEIEFDSTIPARLGLPALPPGTNPAEGIVIKPAQIITLPDGTRLRPVLKRKIASFAEDARFHQAKAWDTDTASASSDTSYHLDLLEWEATARLNPNRIAAVLSKEGRVSASDARAVERVAQAIVEDIFEDLEQAHAEPLAGLDTDDRALVESALLDDAIHALLDHLGGT